MFEDQTVELLPARTTMKKGGWGGKANVQSGNLAIAIAINAGNINFGGTQVNAAEAISLAGSNVVLGG